MSSVLGSGRAIKGTHTLIRKNQSLTSIHKNQGFALFRFSVANRPTKLYAPSLKPVTFSTFAIQESA